MVILILLTIITEPQQKAQAGPVTATVVCISGIIALLAALGITFATEAQAQTMATYVYNNMPRDIREDLTNAFINKFPISPLIVAGVGEAAILASGLIESFRDWIMGDAGITDTVLNAGIFDMGTLGLTGGVITGQGGLVLPIATSEAMGVSASVPLASFTIGNLNYQYNGVIRRGAPANTAETEHIINGIRRIHWYWTHQPFSHLAESLRMTFYLNAQGGINWALVSPCTESGVWRVGGGSSGQVRAANVMPASQVQPAIPHLELTSSAFRRNIADVEEDGNVAVLLPPTSAIASTNPDANVGWEDIFRPPSALNPGQTLPGQKTLEEQFQEMQDVLDQLRGHARPGQLTLEQQLSGLRTRTRDAELTQAEREAIRTRVRDITEELTRTLNPDGTLTRDLTTEQIDDIIRDVTRDIERIIEDIDRSHPPGGRPPGGNVPTVFAMFPFCIPWDVYNFVRTITASQVEPKIEFNMFTFLGQYGIATEPWVIEFSRFQVPRLLLRWGIFVLGMVGLFKVTKKYIWTGGG